MSETKQNARDAKRPMILLNPGPANTTATVKAAMTKPDICPREREFGEVVRQVRDGLTRLVDPSFDQKHEYMSVLFGGSGTAAVEAAIASAVPHDGKLLIIDNGAYGERMKAIAVAYGIPHDTLLLGVGGYPDVDRIARTLEASHYTQLAVVHHETSTGMLNPIKDIGAICHERGVETIVDAMSSYAGMPMDMREQHIDFLISSSNKCVQGMAGLGFVICKRDRLEQMKHVSGRSYYLSMAGQHQFFEKTGQMQFTPPVQVVYALEQAISELVAEGGVAARHRRYVQNWEALDAGMRQLGFRRLLSEAILSRILTAYIEPDHVNYGFDALHDRLYAKGFTIYPGKGAQQDTFRLANMGAVTAGDMQAFISAMSETLDEMGVRPLYSTPHSTS